MGNMGNCPGWQIFRAAVIFLSISDVRYKYFSIKVSPFICFSVIISTLNFVHRGGDYILTAQGIIKEKSNSEHIVIFCNGRESRGVAVRRDRGIAIIFVKEKLFRQ